MSKILYGLRHDRFPRGEIDLARHGTEAGSRAHWRRGETPCDACRKAHNRRQADRRKARNGG